MDKLKENWNRRNKRINRWLLSALLSMVFVVCVQPLVFMAKYDLDYISAFKEYLTEKENPRLLASEIEDTNPVVFFISRASLWVMGVSGFGFIIIFFFNFRCPICESFLRGPQLNEYFSERTLFLSYGRCKSCNATYDYKLWLV